jgi:polysaccharide pyruvyl transferase CsaB
VLISGYYGFGNAGDEVILRAMLRVLQGHTAEVLSADPARTRREHGVSAVPRQAVPAVLRAVARCDLLGSGGGGLLQDATGPASVPYYLGVIAAARVLRKPFMIYAQGIGPLRAGWARASLRLLRGAARVTVRDAESAELLQSAGVSGVEITADAALALPRPVPGTAVPAELAQLGLRPGEVALGIAPRPHPAAAVAAALAGAADALARALPARIVLVPMQFPEDAAACEAVAAGMAQPAIVLRRPIAPERYPEVFAGFQAVLGMRLHALILAALAGVPAVGLSYDPKIEAFLRGLGRGHCALGLESSAAAITAQVRAVFPARPADQAALEAAVERLQALARRNDAALLALLGGGAP